MKHETTTETASGAITTGDQGSVRAAHTPGPWRVEDYDLPPRYLTALPPMTLIRSSSPTAWWVALATVDSGDGFPNDTKERDANARLIAAAPDGLEFAQFYDSYMSAQFPDGLQLNYENGTLHPKAAEAWGRCKTFITKATGESK